MSPAMYRLGWCSDLREIEEIGWRWVACFSVDVPFSIALPER
ncbi:hypothetical protein [Stenomitos frigidus]|nr:hypothetical protein [Stenomitos frigidus]